MAGASKRKPTKSTKGSLRSDVPHQEEDRESIENLSAPATVTTNTRSKRVSKPSKKKKEGLDEVEERKKKKVAAAEKSKATRKKKVDGVQRAKEAAPDPHSASTRQDPTDANEEDVVAQLHRQIAELQGQVGMFG